jgi:hypothetical protein
MKNKLFLILILAIFASTTFAISSTDARGLSTELKGNFLLQVESHGEAWYVDPISEKRFPMGTPDQAFEIIKQFGIGITNDNLTKIQVADANLSGPDSDGDGLSDRVELGLGTDLLSADTDGDGFNDKTELIYGFSPLTKLGNQVINKNFANKNKGKIFLQVESLGEAWYVNPTDGKRYFLGSGTDALNVMKTTGLGISNANLQKIADNLSDLTLKTELDIYNIYKDTDFMTVSDAEKKYVCDSHIDWHEQGYYLENASKDQYDKLREIGLVCNDIKYPTNKINPTPQAWQNYSKSSPIARGMMGVIVKNQFGDPVAGAKFVVANTSHFYETNNNGYGEISLALTKAYIPQFGVYSGTGTIYFDNYENKNQIEITLNTKANINGQVLRPTKQQRVSQVANTATRIVGKAYCTNGSPLIEKSVSLYQSSGYGMVRTDLNGNFILSLPGESSSHLIYFPELQNAQYFLADSRAGWKTTVELTVDCQ